MKYNKKILFRKRGVNMRNYQCTKCGVVVQKSQRPMINGCPSAAAHNWQDLGDVGSEQYQCRKCGCVVNSKSRPTTINGCPSAAAHNWNKL